MPFVSAYAAPMYYQTHARCTDAPPPIYIPSSLSRSCNENGVIASTSIDITTGARHTFLSISNTAAGSHHLFTAQSSLTDAITVNPVDSSLLGTEGSLRFNIRLDGRVMGGRLGLLAWDYVDNNLGGASIFSRPTAQSSLSSPLIVGLLGPFFIIDARSAEAPAEFAIDLLVDYHVVFGQEEYAGLDLILDGELGSFMDVQNSLIIKSVSAYNELGDNVLFDLAAASGIRYTHQIYSVAEPSGLLIVVFGLTAMGLFSHRRT